MKSYLALRIVSVSLYVLAALVLLVGLLGPVLVSLGTHDSWIITVAVVVGSLMTAVMLTAVEQLVALAIDVARSAARTADATERRA